VEGLVDRSDPGRLVLSVTFRSDVPQGPSPAQLGWRVGMTGRMVAAVEEGRHALLSLQDVERIADALGVATWDLLDS